MSIVCFAVAPAEGEDCCSLDVVSPMMQAIYGEMGRCEKWEKKRRTKASRCLASILAISGQDAKGLFTGESKMMADAVAFIKKGVAGRQGDFNNGGSVYEFRGI